MTESALTQLARKWQSTAIPAYQYKNALTMFPSELIGGIDVAEWAQKVVKSTGSATTAWNKFKAPAEGMDIESFRIPIYRTSKRIDMSYEEFALFSRINVLPVGVEDAISRVTYKCGYNLWRGPVAGEDQVLTPAVSGLYNYISDAGTGNGTAIRPLISTTATAGAWGTAGNAQTDITILAGQLESKGYSVANSVVFYPMIASNVMFKHLPFATGSYMAESVKELLLKQGFMDVIPIADEFMYTAAGADPTAALFDLYAVDLSSVRIGYNLPERAAVIDVPPEHRYQLEFEVGWAPLFTPRYWSDSKYYKGVSRITAIAQS